MFVSLVLVCCLCCFSVCFVVVVVHCVLMMSVDVRCFALFFFVFLLLLRVIAFVCVL